MDVTITTKSVSIAIPIIFIFWGFVAVYVIHILEESVLGEVFVEKLRKNIWPEYGWKHFFGFNTLLMSLNIIAILTYETLGGAWLIFPLSLALERCLNGFWHLGETILTKKFSSGLLSSTLVWILTYWLIRYALWKGEISLPYFLISLAIGACITSLMLGSMLAFRRKYGVAGK
jgi:hypothetical protein